MEYYRRKTRREDFIPRVRIKFEPRDLWVGVFWHETRSVESTYRKLEVYVCLVPMLPIRFMWEWGWR